MAYYKKIKDSPAYQKQDLPKDSPVFKASVNQLTLSQLEKAYPYLTRLYPGPDALERLQMTETERQQADYVLDRYQEVLAQQLVNWRSPTAMQDYASYIKASGRNPYTGQKVDEGTRLMAEHYSWVKGSSTLVASLISAKIDFDEMMVANHTGNKNYRSQDDLLGSFEDSMSPEDAK